jgi:dTMP kinase
VEGPDGAGKSTQAALLAARLESAGWKVARVREPGGTPTGERIREVLLDRRLGGMTAWTELFLFMASRKQLIDEVVRPALKKGRAVVSDRFLLSSVVYQGIVGKVGAGRVTRVAREAFGDCLPDLNVIIDLPAGRGLARARGRSRRADRIEAKGLGYARKVRSGFLEAARMRSAGRTAVVDGRASPEEVAEAVWREVRRVL